MKEVCYFDSQLLWQVVEKDEMIFQKLVAMMVTNTPAWLESLQTLEKDKARLSILLHRIQGSIGYFNRAILLQQIQKCEEMCKVPHIKEEDLQMELTSLIHMFKGFLQELKTFQASTLGIGDSFR